MNQGAAIRQLEQFNFHHVLEETPGYSLVIFGTESCGSCRAMKQVLKEYSGTSALNIFSVDAQRDLALVREFDIFHLPAMFLFKDGVFHCEFQCEASLDSLVKELEVAFLAPAEEAP
jgi:thioredoxin-like negative regulator of GroEL